MSYADRERVRKLKKQEPDVITSALSGVVLAGMLGTLVADAVDYSSPAVADGLDNFFCGNAVGVNPDLAAKGIQEMLDGKANLNFAEHGIQVVGQDVRVPWDAKVFEAPAGSAAHDSYWSRITTGPHYHPEQAMITPQGPKPNLPTHPTHSPQPQEKPAC